MKFKRDKNVQGKCYLPQFRDPRVRGDDGGCGGDEGGYSANDGGKSWDLRKVRGFTLLEVMIALLVIALGMGAVINTTTEAGWKATHLKQSTIANWVAYNQIALYRAKRVWDGKTRLGGDTEMANVEWTWEMELSGTDDPSLRRIDVEVFLKGDDVVKARVSGFVANL